MTSAAKRKKEILYIQVESVPDRNKQNNLSKKKKKCEKKTLALPPN